ncbi:hypothetical protein EX895_006327 [Sporisorium graminicola]|uniref:Uncharacterized protein n=1 Tax=Sporisorium graminicola TaxID=280036 RepID=A0A4U7KN26_9BASI|nr:hypothetical protein EX895_006327 [Sporisorium graminicola]TKY85247.1 hypothetical protein EX895_006327 [Sporisorium graminicola]
MIHAKRLLPNDHLEPVVEKFTSQGLSLKRDTLLPKLALFDSLDNEGDYTQAKRDSLIPKLPLFGSFDNEGDYSNVRKRLLDFVKSLEPSKGTEYLEENHQTLGPQHTVHPLNRRHDAANPLDVAILGEKLPFGIPTKLPGSKRSKSSGLDLLGYKIPLNAIEIPSASKRGDSPVDLGLKADNKEGVDAVSAILESLVKTSYKRDDSPLDLGLKTGNKQDLDSAKSLLGGLIPTKREEQAPVQPLDLGLHTGNEQDLERAKSILGGLLGGAATKRDTISTDKIDLSSFEELGQAATKEGAKALLPLAFAPVRQAASPAVQGIKAVNSVCNAFGCYPAIESVIKKVKDEVTNEVHLPVPGQARALGDQNLLANGLLNGNGQIEGVPVKRDQDPVTAAILDTSDKARDEILDVKTAADNAAGAFVKNMYSKHGEVKERGDLNFPGLSLLPGTGPSATETANKLKEDLKEVIDFTGLPLPGAKRMEKVRRK